MFATQETRTLGCLLLEFAWGSAVPREPGLFLGNICTPNPIAFFPGTFEVNKPHRYVRHPRDKNTGLFASRIPLGIRSPQGPGAHFGQFLHWQPYSFFPRNIRSKQTGKNTGWFVRRIPMGIRCPQRPGLILGYFCTLNP
jgi:hypothetical protein